LNGQSVKRRVARASDHFFPDDLPGRIWIEDNQIGRGANA
jgi:hypothetical protein